MSQQILQSSDFKVGSVVHNIQGVLYRGEGSPLGQRISTQLGAIYIDITSGNLWIANSTSLNTGWQPFYSQITTNITISSDVQEGDLIGIYGAGVWTLSGNLTSTRENPAGAGSQNAGLVTGGGPGTSVSSSELFNGSVWTTSANMNATRAGHGGAGSQNAGLMAGGIGTNILSTSELFNGATWSNSGNMVSTSRFQCYGAGSQNAGLMAAGLTPISTSELFNGATWAAASNMTQNRNGPSGAGSQNAGLMAGGTTLSTSELFNGSTWTVSGNTAVTNIQVPAGAGSQNAAFMAGGTSGGSGSSSQLFNGSTWTASGNMNQTKNQMAGAGSQSAGLVAGGTSGVAAITAELHSQTTYRRLNYTSLPSANNAGMALNVSSTANTASLCTGDVLNTRLASQNFFGFNKYTQENSNIVLEATRNITSITASGQTAIITTSSNTAIANGMLLLITGASNAGNNGLFPVTANSGGTQITVKNANAVTQGSSTGTVQLIYSNRLSGMTTSSITVSGNTATITFSAVGGLSASQFQRLVKVGGNIYIPFSSTSGASGSQFNWGTYRITGVGSFTVTLTTLNTEAITETIACTNVEYFAQCFTETTIPQGSHVMGFNNRLGLIQREMTDCSNNY